MSEDKTKAAGKVPGAGPKAEGKTDAIKLKDLIERVAASSGLKKSDARKAVEATLAELSTAVEAGEALALPPLGRLTLAKRKATGKGEVMTLKLRRGGAEKSGKLPLAAEDD